MTKDEMNAEEGENNIGVGEQNCDPPNEIMIPPLVSKVKLLPLVVLKVTPRTVTTITDMTCASAQHQCVQKAAEGGESGMAMSTIEEVRAAEKKVQEALDALKKAGTQNPNYLSIELRTATDEYASAVRELRLSARTCHRD